MNLVRLLVALIAFSVGFLSSNSYARLGAGVARDLQKAADSAVGTYKTDGMTGLVAKTTECYATNAKNRFYCLYLDLASRKIDRMFVDSMGWPPTQFFGNEAFGPRVMPVFVEAGMDMHDANSYLRMVTPVIDDLVLKKILAK
jgi:hypothetical protein